MTPALTGVVTCARAPLVLADGRLVQAIQLTADQVLGDYRGYSGSAVFDARGNRDHWRAGREKQLRARMHGLGAGLASNVLYAVPIPDALAAKVIKPAKAVPG